MTYPSYKSIHGRELGITPNGLRVHNRDITPNLFTQGNMYFVNSEASNADDSNTGLSPSEALATLDGAVGKCTANQGDHIILLPGHAEDLSTADGADIDVAGVSVIGLGVGSDRPTFTYTAAAGEVVIGADNVLIENCVFNASVTTVLLAIDVEDGVDYATIRNCEFGVDLAGTDEFNAAIHFTNNNKGCLVEDCLIDQGLGGAVAGIHLDADTDGLTIRNNIIRGDYSTANIAGDTTLSTHLLIEGNVLFNGDGTGVGTEPGIELLTGTEGVIRDNDIATNLATIDAAIVADGCMMFRNLYCETVTETGTLIGTESADD